jgi:ribonuclease T1
VTARLKALGAVLALLLLAVAGFVGGTTAERDPTAAVPAATQSRPVDPSTSSGDAATRSGSTSTGLPVVDLDRLPVQARRTVALIDSGGPFPYAKDGATFGNRERLLPLERSGYYREYTVPTPGSDDRGARRVIAGDAGRQLFYTDDHYASFVRIRR